MIAWLAIAIIGHFGTRLAIYNRLNALGIDRPRLKRIEKTILAETMLTPLLASWALWTRLDASQTDTFLATSQIPSWIWIYGWICIGCGGVLGCLWLLWRPLLRVQHVEAPRRCRVVDAQHTLPTPLPLTRKCQWAARIPGNQMFELSVEEIDLPVHGLPMDLSGYRIAQLSDIHFTGHVDPSFAQLAVEEANAWRPDMMVLTGDIVDKPIGVSWCESTFGHADALDAKVFILGNHDTRVSDPAMIRNAMTNAGWTNLGGKVIPMSIRNTSVSLIGNESPWFDRPTDSAMSQFPGTFRLCLSHSPDQYDWCRQHDVQLMLAGHTHGGQGRLPLAGPILSPSWHGSRWASGDFFRNPTTLHVTRGLGGVHLLRWRCRPELSLLTLRPA
ncbi:MAG: metallophosphoesterase [Planctomycetota bacterium]